MYPVRNAFLEAVKANNVYQFLLDFDTLYERMTDLEKKQFMRTFIESIELYPEKKDNGRIISTIELRLPVYYDGQEGNEISGNRRREKDDTSLHDNVSIRPI